MKISAVLAAASILSAGSLVSCGATPSNSEFASALVDAWMKSEPIHPNAETALKEYVLSSCGSDKMKAISYLYPRSILKAIKDTDIADNYSVANMEGAKLTEFHIAKYSRVYADFGRAGFEAAAEYFRRIASDNGIDGCSPCIGNGYNVEVEFTVKSDGGEFSDKLTATVVVVLGEGWKVIPMSTDDLMEAVKE